MTEQSGYRAAYQSLNARQKEAVDQTDGPVLVVAGPGTGKTQLLATRIAHILATTDAQAENILCLTFTEAAANNMRRRLSTLIGQAAYDVTIHTYHGFGNEILKKHPEYFAEFYEKESADELSTDQVIRRVQKNLPYANSLKSNTFTTDIKKLISDFKSAELSAEDVRKLAKANSAFVAQASQLVALHLAGLTRITKGSIAAFANLLIDSANLDGINDTGSLAYQWHTSLAEAVAAAQETQKTTTITKWKSQWLVKDVRGNFSADGERAARRMLDAADIYEHYIAQLDARGLYDYDDMILQAIAGLETFSDLRFTLQERYQYLLLDEFQDTNQAQLSLVYLMTDNPVNEGRPNVLAVGDDDQAIYAFQGADYSHMRDFYAHFVDTKIVTLTENYRSQAAVLELSEQISKQIDERLQTSLPAVNKTLQAASKPRATTLERHEFMSDVSQNVWIADQVEQLIASGTPAHEIAIITPKHRYLQSVVPFLHRKGIAVHYDRRENILDDPIVSGLVLYAQLAIAISNVDIHTANELWPEVLSRPEWQLKTEDVWRVTWSAGAHDNDITKTLVEHEIFKPIALFFIAIAAEVQSAPLEDMLDMLMGVTPLQSDAEMRSPFYAHYFGAQVVDLDQPAAFWQLLSNIALLRHKLREYQKTQSSQLHLTDFVDYLEAHRASDIKIVNTNPHQYSDDAVQLMTVFKAKGLEFDAVFVIAANDEAWGSRVKSNTGKIMMPHNLKHISYKGASQDERLRQLFVAFTRAKTKLYITNYLADFSGKAQSRLKYLNEYDTPDGPISPMLATNTIIIEHSDAATTLTSDDLQTYWQARHIEATTNPMLRKLLQTRLENFTLSASHVLRFTSTDHDGPRSFLLKNLLKFPSGSSVSGKYGDAIHETLHWTQLQLKSSGQTPSLADVQECFTQRLRAKHLPHDEQQRLVTRGHDSLSAYYHDSIVTFTGNDRSEYNFAHESVFVGDAHLSGKIDRLKIDPTAKTIEIIDFKTGQSFDSWSATTKLHGFKLQLYFYKTLVEKSTTFKNYQVVAGTIDFVEPNESGTISHLTLQFNDEEAAYFEQLTRAVWQYITTLTFPDTSSYGNTLKARQTFEQFLINET